MDASSSGDAERSRRRRRRRRAPSTSSSSSSSSIERANWRHSAKRAKYHNSDTLLENLCNQVEVLTNFMHNIVQNNEIPSQSILPGATDSTPTATLETELQNEGSKEFCLKSLQTTLKESGFGKTDQDRFDIINSLQLFGSPDWLNINFIDTQKSYLSKPGFVELETNDDLKPYDKNKFLPSCERTFAALSNAILLQRGMLQNNVTQLLTWVKDLQSVSYDEFSAKIKELFCEDKDYNEISNNIMQIICGKRASIINNRRTKLLKSVSNNFTADKFKKIPPSPEFLFQPDQFNSLLEKEGGPTKVFQKPQLAKTTNVSFKGQPPKFAPKNQYLTSFRGNTNGPSVQSSKQDLSSRGKRKYSYDSNKKSSGRRHGGDSKRRRYD
ncbi:uncharacterized protein LOC114362382 [Ostrinia furnacalis]|uniref:uncharacterized protein LOC114362382 n=1 Tax=Ostrinia furnacalis TaxID=93504 RepID=UPI001040D637|nr:uncharacterized protein LOC114362382 [Ostrinia furnacalis]